MVNLHNTQGGTVNLHNTWVWVQATFAMALPTFTKTSASISGITTLSLAPQHLSPELLQKIALISYLTLLTWSSQGKKHLALKKWSVGMV